MNTCDPQWLPGRQPQKPCTGSVQPFQAQDPVTGLSVSWSLCDRHRNQYLLYLRCRNRFVSPYMVRQLCLRCAELLRERGE